jgi:hypothetical protein
MCESILFDWHKHVYYYVLLQCDYHDYDKW